LPPSSSGPVAPVGLDVAPEAAISDGRIVYASRGDHGGETLSAVDLQSGGSTGLITFPPFPNTSGLLGIGLDGDTLAWAEQDTEPVGSHTSLPGGGSEFTCRTEALGAPTLHTFDIATLPAAPMTITGVKGAQQTGLPCTALES
jgi:hypothetical protein